MKRSVLIATWVVLLAVILTAILLPNYGLAQLRVEQPWFSRLISWSEKTFPQLDTIHILMFFSLTVLCRLTWGLTFFSTLMGPVLVGAATEIIQLWVPGRRASWSDFGQDLIGISIAACACLIIHFLPMFKPRDLNTMPQRR